MTGRQIYVRLLGHVRPHWRPFAVAIFAMVAVGLSEPAIPALLQIVVSGFENERVDKVPLYAAGIVALFFARGLASFTSGTALAAVSSRVVADLRMRMFDRLLVVPARYYDDNNPGAIISKITYNSSQVTEAATNVLTVLVRDSLSVLGLLAWMIYLDWKLTLLALVSAPVTVLVVKLCSSRLRKVSRRLQEVMGDVSHVVEEVSAGQKVVRTFGAQDYERRRFGAAVNKARSFSLRFAAISEANSPITQLATAIALAVILVISARQFEAGVMTIGSFVSFFTAMGMLFRPLKRLTSVNGALQRGIAAAESLFELMDEPREPDDGTVDIGRAKGELELREVRIAYGDSERAALDGVSLSIAAGETIALVGPSGSGKTSIANLIPRFYTLDGGRVLLDGKDIATLSLRSLRDQIALVSQDVVLFNDTVSANIAYGRDDVSESEIAAAARAAYAIEFIERLPQRFQTAIGQRGVRLSGGQRQRLAIARAFLKDAPVLILDEATSALDTASERHVQAAVEALRRGRTTIVIAHRLSSVEHADRIAVLDQGRIVDVGKHAELLARCSLYAGLYRFQADQPHEIEAPAAARR